MNSRARVTTEWKILCSFSWLFGFLFYFSFGRRKPKLCVGLFVGYRHNLSVMELTNRTKGKRKGNWRAPIDNTTVSRENAEQFLDWPSTIREFTFTWRRTTDFVCHLISRQLFVLVFVWFKRSGRQEKKGGYVGGWKIAINFWWGGSEEINQVESTANE